MLTEIAITTRRMSRETKARRRSLSERNAQYGLKRSSEDLKFICKAPAKDSGRKSVRNSVSPEHFGAALDEPITSEHGRTKQVSIGSMTYEPFDESMAARRAEFLRTCSAPSRRRSPHRSASEARGQAYMQRCGLTLPSSGLAPAARVWPSFHSGPSPRHLREPLMSNVRRREYNCHQV